MDATTLNLLAQIPLAGLVVFLTVWFLRHLERSNERANTALFDFLSKESETNRQFLKTQREQMNDAVAKLSEEVKLMRLEYRQRTLPRINSLQKQDAE